MPPQARLQERPQRLQRAFAGDADHHDLDHVRMLMDRLLNGLRSGTNRGSVPSEHHFAQGAASSIRRPS